MSKKWYDYATQPPSWNGQLCKIRYKLHKYGDYQFANVVWYQDYSSQCVPKRNDKELWDRTDQWYSIHPVQSFVKIAPAEKISTELIWHDYNHTGPTNTDGYRLVLLKCGRMTISHRTLDRNWTWESDVKYWCYLNPPVKKEPLSEVEDFIAYHLLEGEAREKYLNHLEND